jgi:hypothetical protein
VAWPHEVARHGYQGERLGQFHVAYGLYGDMPHITRRLQANQWVAVTARRICDKFVAIFISRDKQN